MAEAHQAVGFSFQITHEGVDVNFDWEVLRLVYSSSIRSWKKRIARFKNNVKAGVWPAPLGSWVLTFGITAGLFMAGFDIFHMSDYFSNYFADRGEILEGLEYRDLCGCFVSSIILWLLCIYTFRYFLKLLLMYKGWMYEKRGPGARPSLISYIWFMMVRSMTKKKPMLYAYQGALPRLPLPSLDATIQRYLKSVRAVENEEQFEKTKRKAMEFKDGIGKKLQRYLMLKSWFTSNYVSDWWEEYVYLRGRSPLMVNSNFYGVDALFMLPTTNQAARAANVIYAALLFRRQIERQELEPIAVQNLVPLCSSQYERVFNTTRIPGYESDKLVHMKDSDHIAVYHKGRWFKVLIYSNRRLLRPPELEIQMQQILDSAAEPDKGEEKLASFTASRRDDWAKNRNAFFQHGLNYYSLRTIESSAFVLALDTEPFEYGEENPEEESLSKYARSLLHGNGHNRWFDKSFTIVVGSNGRIGFNAEHSWADAAVMSHLWEWIAYYDICQHELRYGEDGHTLGQAEFPPPRPTKIRWDMPPECLEQIENTYQEVNKLLNDVDLHLYVNKHYGKGLMKKCRVSPDAFIQMALQLAYFREAGQFHLTYEASMTRLFREGRTETVRPCTVESCAFVRAMENNDVSDDERLRLFRVACDNHQLLYQDAMCGKGIDRHLFCLYVVSRYLEVDSPFLKEVLGEPWRLSTSQTPHGQTTLLDLKKFPKCISAGGGFGPVADDGYGVSYIIAGEDLIFFHVSSKISCGNTNSKRFTLQIERALLDIKSMFDRSGGSASKTRHASNGTVKTQ